MRDSIWINFDGASPLFAERRKHKDIVSYKGIDPRTVDRWLYPTLADLDPGKMVEHNDWDREAFERGGWVR